MPLVEPTPFFIVLAMQNTHWPRGVERPGCLQGEGVRAHRGTAAGGGGATNQGMQMADKGCCASTLEEGSSVTFKLNFLWFSSPEES